MLCPRASPHARTKLLRNLTDVHLQTGSPKGIARIYEQITEDEANDIKKVEGLSRVHLMIWGASVPANEVASVIIHYYKQ